MCFFFFNIGSMLKTGTLLESRMLTFFVIIVLLKGREFLLVVRLVVRQTQSHPVRLPDCLRIFCIGFLLLGLVTCGGGAKSDPPPPPVQNFSIVASPPTDTAAAGSSNSKWLQQCSERYAVGATIRDRDFSGIALRCVCGR